MGEFDQESDKINTNHFDQSEQIPISLKRSILSPRIENLTGNTPAMVVCLFVHYLFCSPP